MPGAFTNSFVHRKCLCCSSSARLCPQYCPSMEQRLSNQAERAECLKWRKTHPEQTRLGIGPLNRTQRMVFALPAREGQSFDVKSVMLLCMLLASSSIMFNFNFFLWCFCLCTMFDIKYEKKVN